MTKISLLFVQLICRLFQLSTNIYQRKYCRQISFLLRNIFFPFAQLTGPGQVTVPPPPLSSVVSSYLLKTKLFSCFFCSGLFPVWSLTNYSHHQRGKKELPSFHNSSMCSSWWHFCHDRLASTHGILCALCIFFWLSFTDSISCIAFKAVLADELRKERKHQ